MEEIKESKDSVDNKNIFNSTLPSEGSPSGLTRDIKPGLGSSNKNNKNIMKEGILEDLFMHSVRPTQEICLSIQIAPASSQNDFTKLDMLLDSGANTIFIDKTWVQKHKVLLTPLQNPIPVYNVDRTWNSAGSITHAVELIVEFQGHHKKIMAEVTDLGKNSFILGFFWLKCHNPDIDWTKGTVKMTCCLRHCHMLQPKSAFLASLEKEEYDIQYQVHKTIHALEVQQEKPKEKTSEELVPKEYHKFLKVFSKKESGRMPLQKPWDHTIDLKDMFKPKKGHIIPLSPAEQEEVMAFLDDQLKKGYIQYALLNMWMAHCKT